jgi:hypothetical protein
LPDCSRTMYSAYQSGQLGSVCLSVFVLVVGLGGANHRLGKIVADA